MFLRTYLKQNGIRQRDFAKMLSVTEPTLSRIIKHPDRITFQLAKQIHFATEGKVTFTDWVEQQRQGGD